MAYCVDEYREQIYCPRCLEQLQNGDDGDLYCRQCDATMSHRLPLSLTERDAMAKIMSREEKRAIAEGFLRTVPSEAEL